MLNESVIKVLKNSMWDLATCANGEPNVVPVAFKDVTEDGKLVVGDVFLETTLNNIKANDGKIAISVYDTQSLEGYQIKGTAEYVTEGDVVDTFKAMVESMFVTTPGADNKKEIQQKIRAYTKKLDSNFKNDHLQAIMNKKLEGGFIMARSSGGNIKGIDHEWNHRPEIL